MRLRRTHGLLLLLMAGIFLLGASPALAQVPTGQCNGPESEIGQFAVTPSSGPAGSSAVVTGSFQVQPAVDAGSQPVSATAQDGNVDVEAWWYETGPGDAVTLGGFEITIDENLIAHFSGNVVIPAGAAPGPHDIALLITGLTDPNCVTFTVTQSVQADAYTVATLANTGADPPAMMLVALAPAAGFLLLRRLRPLRQSGRFK